MLFDGIADAGFFEAISDISFHFHANFSDIWYWLVGSAKYEV